MRYRHIVAAATAAALISLGHPAWIGAQPTNAPSRTQQRIDAALQVFTLLQAQYSIGTATVDEVGAWGARWYQARRDAGLSGSALTAAAQEWVDKMIAFERGVSARVSAGAASATDSQKATYFRLDAEIELARVKRP